MILTKHIFDEYEERIKVAIPKQVEALEKEVEALRKWGDRRNNEVVDVPYVKTDIPRLVEKDGKIQEVLREQLFFWGLIGANKDLLPSVDERVFEAFKTTKKIGFERPSIVVYGRFYYYIHRDLWGEYDGEKEKWCGVQLLLRRMESTVRIALRFDDPDKYGPRTVFHQDGSVTYEYGKDPWRRELKRRGVIPRRKRKG